MSDDQSRDTGFKKMKKAAPEGRSLASIVVDP